MKSVYIYGEPAEKTLDPEEIVRYIRAKLPRAKVNLRKDFLLHWLDLQKEKDIDPVRNGIPMSVGISNGVDPIARGLVGCRVGDLSIRGISKEEKERMPFPVEIEYEKKTLLEPEKRKPGIVYDGFLLQEFLNGLIPPEERKMNHWHIVFTNRLLATWDEKDNRYHLRSGVYGSPDLISTGGIVEAPAKPKDYYISKGLGEIAIADWKEKNKEKFIDYDDPRLTEVAKGYVMQAVFYHLTGDSFCKSKTCRLYNAHWQEELIKAQLNKKKEFCVRHQRILDSLR